jgi:hypothetical protein
MYTHLKIGGMYFGCKKEKYYTRERCRLHDREREHCIKKFYKNLLHFFYYNRYLDMQRIIDVMDDEELS